MQKFRASTWIILTVFTLGATQARAEGPNYHLVGWLNTFVPGSGALLNDHPLEAGIQATAEVSTFLYGYNLSHRTPLTIDGVPEDLEVSRSNIFTSKTTTTICVQYKVVSGKLKCIKTGTSTTITNSLVQDTNPLDDRVAGYADILQEFGLKYHMVNVFNAYREAAGSAEIGQGIDQSSTNDLFLAPFRTENILNPWVYAPFLGMVGVIIEDYVSTVRSGVNSLQPMNGISNQLLAFNYEIWQPIGSGAPEEMFYRGFLQNEAYTLVPSPYFSIPLSTLAFSFSHAPAGRPTAAVAGAYLGFLANKNHGTLGPGITLHFWTVVLLGIETIALTARGQGYAPLRYIAFDLHF